VRYLLSRSTQVVIDLVVLGLSFLGAFVIRFDWDIPATMLSPLLTSLPYVVALQYAVMSAFGIPRFSWRYIGLREITWILQAILIAAGVLLATRLIAPRWLSSTTYYRNVMIPFGVIAIDTVLAFMGTAGVRALRRQIGERAESKGHARHGKPAVATLLIGAGQAGLMVAKELSKRGGMGFRAVGFVDDDKSKLGTIVHGIKVIGTTDEIPKLRDEFSIKEAIITIANAPPKQIRRLAMLCESIGLPAKIVPGVYEIVGGDVNLSRMRKVAIEDLLGRDPVTLDDSAISAQVQGKTVLVSGAGGSIGSELCRQLMRFSPGQLVLVDQSENDLFHIHRELAAAGGKVVPVIASVGDRKRMAAVFQTHQPSIVYHAAAYKHVPMMEWNPAEALRNNVLGTQTLAELSDQNGVATFVMVSTDKAVNPTSVMGASKRAAEIFVQSLSQKSKTHFVAVRFGNVLGSAGSVVPIFKEQIERGGPVTVTHPDMERYFMTIPEACQLIMQAGAMGKGGEIFILDMGKAVKIVDLARDLIGLSGLVAGEDIEIQFTGVRPGEKLFEELSVDAEAADATRHPKIFVGKLRPYDDAVVQQWFNELRMNIENDRPIDARATLRALIPEMREPEGS
jgi:FlaA1/EpsC-like NDP-sugar epimerase